MQRWLSPGRWLLPAVALWWGMRFAGLLAMRAFREIPMEPAQLAMGLAFDVLLLQAFFLLGRATWTTAPASSAPGTSPQPGSYRLLWLVPVASGLTLAVLRSVDTAGCFFGLAHMTETMWQHIAPGSLGYVLTAPFAAAAVAVFAVAAALIFAGRQDARQWQARPAVCPALAQPGVGWRWGRCAAWPHPRWPP